MPTPADITQELKVKARKEDDETAAAIKGMSPEQQKEFLQLSPAERAKRLAELKTKKAPEVAKPETKTKAKTTPTTTLPPKPNKADLKYEKADGTFNLALWQKDELAYNRAKIKAAGSPATAGQ